MNYGCFGHFRDMDDIISAGFSSIEADFQELADLSENAFKDLLCRSADLPLTFTVFSGLLPLYLRFFQDFDEEYWFSRIRKGAFRAKALGCRIIPFGAGKCRSLPPSVNLLTGMKRNAQIVRQIADILMEADIILAVEPLGPSNSNFLNTITETASFIDLVHRPNCLAMCDLRHMVHSRDPLDNILKYRDIIRHAHIDYPLGELRYFPAQDDGYDYSEYLEMLARANYNNLLTIEATAVKRSFYEEAAEGLRLIKEACRDL